ncbi:MAG: DUF3365 domain-containing protein [Gammaproteobacteria bacterium]
MRVPTMRLLALIGVVGCLVLGSPLAGEVEDRLAGSRAATGEFAMALKSALSSAMASGGPTYAVDVCQEQAPEIAAQVSQAKGWDVGRTSLRLRNSNNAPDAWERGVLEEFERRVAGGEDPQQMEQYAVVSANGQDEFRYMKAIPTQPVCLTCHGEALAPSVAARLKEAYPQDQATGFSVGDLRGAFTIRQPLQE